MKDFVRLIRYLPKRRLNHPANKEKGWDSLGCFELSYHEISIVCNLIRGKNGNAEMSYFYFLELPCIRYKDSKGKWIKANFFNFESKDLSNEFQDLAFGLILDAHSELFDDVFLSQKMTAQCEKKPVESINTQ